MPRKIFVDSRFAIDGANTSEFTVELPENITTGPTTKAQVLDVTVPHTWWNIETDVNDRLYYLEKDTQGTIVARFVVIPGGHYTRETVSTTLVGLLNANKTIGNYGSYVINTTGTNAVQGTITLVVSSGMFAIIPDIELSQSVFYNLQWSTVMSGPAYDITDLRSCNEMFRLTVATGFVSSWTPVHVNLLHVHTCFLHAPDLISNYDNMGAMGERTIIKRIPVTVPYNYVQQAETSGSPFDYFECFNRSLKTLRFSIRTSRNKALNLHGAQCSFSIVFFD